MRAAVLALSIVVGVSCPAPSARAATPAPAAPPGPPAAAATAPGSSPAIDAERDAAAVAQAVARGDYDARLRDLAARVAELRERVFQSKARLLQLQEAVLRGRPVGARIDILHENRTGRSFRLVGLQVVLDGAPIMSRADSGAGDLEGVVELEVYAGAVPPGAHHLAVSLEYRAYGYGLFSYLDDYRFKVRSSHAFTAEEGKVTTVRIVGLDEGGITTQLRDRLGVRFDVEASPDPRAAQAH